MVAESQSRQEEIEQQNAAACPVIEAIDLVGTPWRLNILFALEDDEKRFNELKRSTGARSKTLSDALDELVDNDLVTRRMEEDAPVAVYYGLTSKGAELLEALAPLDDWAQTWEEKFPSEPGRFR